MPTVAELIAQLSKHDQNTQLAVNIEIPPKKKERTYWEELELLEIMKPSVFSENTIKVLEAIISKDDRALKHLKWTGEFDFFIETYTDIWVKEEDNPMLSRINKILSGESDQVLEKLLAYAKTQPTRPKHFSD